MTNVRFSHNDRKLISVGGADTSVMVWTHNAGSREPVSDETVTSQSGDPVVTSSGFSSEDSDTDSEEEGTHHVLMFSFISWITSSLHHLL